MAIRLGGSGLLNSFTTQVIAPGLITAMTVRQDEPYTQPGQVYLECSIAFGQADPVAIRDTLVTGYVTKGNPLTWTGLYEITSDAYLILRAYGYTPYTVYFTAIPHRITLTRDGELTKFINSFNPRVS